VERNLSNLQTKFCFRFGLYRSFNQPGNNEDVNLVELVEVAGF
jgi:hypothetical protein